MQPIPLRCDLSSLRVGMAALLVLAAGCDRKPSPATTPPAQADAAPSASSSAPAPSAPAASSSSAPRFPTFAAPPKPIDKFKYGMAWVRYLSDGRRFVTSGNGSPVRVFSVADGSVERELEPVRKDRGMTPAALLKDGDVVTCRDGEVRRWDPLTGTMKGVLLKGTHCGNPAHPSPDGKYVTWIDPIGILHLLDVAAGSEKTKASGDSMPILFGFSPASDRVCVWSWLAKKGFPRSVPELELLQPLAEEPCRLGGYAVSEDGKRWVFGRVQHSKAGEAGQVVVRTRDGSEPDKELAFHFLGPSWIGFVDGGRVLLALGGNQAQGMIRGWSVGDWKQLFSVDMDGEPNSFDVSPDGTVLLWAGYGGRLQFRDVHTGERMAMMDTCCTMAN
jgi:WD40 repeat protein